MGCLGPSGGLGPSGDHGGWQGVDPLMVPIPLMGPKHPMTPPRSP